VKIAIYVVLALLLFSAILTPLTEVFVLGKDKLLLSSTLYNSFRAAKEASYFYHEMRNIDAVADEETFLRCFADTFATSYDMDCADATANPLRFTSYNDAFNDFVVYVVFDEAMAGDAVITTVTITAESEYKFRTRYMQLANYGSSNPYLLARTRTFTMRIEN